MFNSTHTFVGFAIARTGADRWVRYATVTAVIASNLPDVDIIAAFSGVPSYIDHHRGITHSLIGVPFFALLLAAVMYFFSGKFWRTYWIALIAILTHPALDYTNTYGLRPFVPFDSAWHYGDVLFIIDPYVDLALFCGILAGQLRPNVRRLATWISLGLAVAYVGARVELHEVAAANLAATVAEIPGVEKWAVFPKILNPLVWEGIIQTKNDVSKVSVNALRARAAADEVITRMDRGPSSGITAHAAKARAAATLLGFARFPVTRVERMPSGYRVTFLDFRFYSEITHTALAAEVILDDSLRVVTDSLSFRQPIE